MIIIFFFLWWWWWWWWWRDRTGCVVVIVVRDGCLHWWWWCRRRRHDHDLLSRPFNIPLDSFLPRFFHRVIVVMMDMIIIIIMLVVWRIGSIIIRGTGSHGDILQCHTHNLSHTTTTGTVVRTVSHEMCITTHVPLPSKYPLYYISFPMQDNRDIYGIVMHSVP